MKLRLLAVIMLFASSVFAAENELAEGFMNIIDETNKVIHQTAHKLTVGDEFIDENNQRWRLESIRGDKAVAKRVGQVKLPAAVFPLELSGVGRDRRPIAIYHTHSDESYLPSSGTTSKHWGDVYRVGEDLKNALEKRGFQVIWSQNNHNPHDGLAYKRSRTTAMEILKKEPAVLIDIHRDAVPLEAYETEIKGDPAAKVMIVVGNQNQNREANLEFAKAIKANADARHKGLVKGILFANGSYNQDLGPRTILLEFGTYENSLEAAQRSAAEWAEIIAAAAYGEAGGASPQQAREQSVGQTRSSVRSILWILGIVLVGGLLYLWLSSGSWGKAISRVKNMGTEFSSAFFDRKEPPDDEKK
ncbi:MAG TPA: stage II sporulation protein P [Bacillota bacterium]|nr:stage II sporulation protein P [Bacillota bacterium]